MTVTSAMAKDGRQTIAAAAVSMNSRLRIIASRPWCHSLPASRFPLPSPWYLWRPIIVHAEEVPPRCVRRDASPEVLPRARGLRRPPDFGECGEPRKRQVLDRRDVADGLAPDRRFHAEHVTLGHSLR